MTNHTYDIVVAGAWHQGYVGAACFAEAGFKVAVIDEQRAHREGQLFDPPVYEPGLKELLNQQIQIGNLTIVSDAGDAIRNASVIALMWDTKVGEDDSADISGTVSFFETEVLPVVRGGQEILVTSQVPVGTCDQLVGRLVEQDASDVNVCYVPENLRLGSAIERFRRQELSVAGTSGDRPGALLTNILNAFADDWEYTDLVTAEMVKHSMNAYLALTICFGNEIGNLCSVLGAKGREIPRFLKKDRRVSKSAMLNPGTGYAGGTLGRDVQALVAFLDGFGLSSPVIRAIPLSNQQQNTLVQRHFQRLLSSGEDEGVRVGILSLTYKRDTSTLRRSSAVELARCLYDMGYQFVTNDPLADRNEIQENGWLSFREDLDDVLEWATVLVIMTDHEQYLNLQLANARSLDTVIDVASVIGPSVEVPSGVSVLRFGETFPRGNGYDHG